MGHLKKDEDQPVECQDGTEETSYRKLMRQIAQDQDFSSTVVRHTKIVNMTILNKT